MVAEILAQFQSIDDIYGIILEHSEEATTRLDQKDVNLLQIY